MSFDPSHYRIQDLDPVMLPVEVCSVVQSEHMGYLPLPSADT